MLCSFETKGVVVWWKDVVGRETGSPVAGCGRVPREIGKFNLELYAFGFVD